jgi:outer membrane protein assembly factor BamB
MAFYGYFKDKGAICCLDADTGGLIWAYEKGYRSTFSSPVVSGKYLVVGEGLHETKNARVYCLDVKASEEKHTGVKLWEFSTKSHVESSPCIFNDKVVIGAGDDGVYCFNLEPDKNGQAHQNWRLDAKEFPDVETSAVYLDGKLYFGLGRYGGQAVVCVDANTGKQEWRVATPTPVVGSPAIANGRLYVGMGIGDFVSSVEAVAALIPEKMRIRNKTEEQIKQVLSTVRKEGEVWCLDISPKLPADANRVVWKFSAGQVFLATPAVDGNAIYAASRDGKLYCITDKGELDWSFDFHEPLLASPAVGKDFVYVATKTGRICGLDKAKKKLVWDLPLHLPPDTFCSSSPAIGRGHLYIGASGPGLMCLGQPAEPWERTAVWPGDLGGAGKGGWDDSILPERGDYAWGYSGPDSNQSAEFAKTITTAAARIGDDFYVGAGKGISKLRCEKGLSLAPKEQWRAKSDNPVTQSAFGSGKSVFFVDGKPGDAGRFLHCVDPNGGAELWRRPIEKDASGASVVTWDSPATWQKWRKAVDTKTVAGFTFTWDHLLIAEAKSGLSCLDTGDPSGPKVVWKAEVGPTVGAPFLTQDGLALVAVANPPRIVAMDPNTGKPAWELSLPRAPTTGPVVAGPRVWVGDAQGLTGAWIPPQPADRKEEAWSVPCGPIRPALAASGFWISCVTTDGEQLVVSAGAGAVVSKLGKAIGDIAPILTDSEVLYLAMGSANPYELGPGKNVPETGKNDKPAPQIRRYDLRGGKSAEWTKMASWGKVLTPMIVADSRLFFVTDEEGLVCMKPKK